MSGVPRGQEEMFSGLTGRVTRTFEPHTEAAPTAIAAQFVVAFGAAVGSGPSFYVGETRHGMNEFLLVVGRTGRARKGDSKNAALRPLEIADPSFSPCVASGLSSAEGLIYHVRDPMIEIDKKGLEKAVDRGATDKRLLAVESEFSSVLKRFGQQGNTLSPLLRDAWDGKSVLRTLTKNTPVKATGAHIGVIAHTTAEDLHQHLDTVDIANGLGNRFLLVETERARVLPHPGRIAAHQLDRLVSEVRATLDHAGRVQDLRWTASAAALWEGIYADLSRDLPGLVGSMLARAEAHVLRLSSLYSLLSQAQEIDVPHLRSALAFWDVVDASARRIFAGRTGNREADRLREAFLPGQRMTLTEVQENIFKNHLPAGRLRDAIRLLVELEEFHLESEPTDGRPAAVLVRRPADGWPPEAAKEAKEARKAVAGAP